MIVFSRLGAIIAFVFWGYGGAVGHGSTKVDPQTEPSFATRAAYVKVFCDSDYIVYLPVSVALTSSLGHIYFFIDDIIGMTWCQRYPSYGLPRHICEIRDGNIPIIDMIFEPEISRRSLPEVLQWNYHSEIEGIPCNSSVSYFHICSKLLIPYIPRVLGHFSRGIHCSQSCFSGFFGLPHHSFGGFGGAPSVEESSYQGEKGREGEDYRGESREEHPYRPKRHPFLGVKIAAFVFPLSAFLVFFNEALRERPRPKLEAMLKC